MAKSSPLIKGFSGIHKTARGRYQALDGEGQKVGRYDTPLAAAKTRDELMWDNYYNSESGEELHT
ncbi:MAG: hypothetical protein JKY50_20220 [Oleispira sp.]|nr:hypothetical protein [Oleispira sp.]